MQGSRLGHPNAQGESCVFTLEVILVHQVNVQIFLDNFLFLTLVLGCVYGCQLGRAGLLGRLRFTPLGFLGYDLLVLSNHII